MQGFPWTEFNAAKNRLKLIVDEIVMERRSNGEPFTWRVMSEIDEEAVARFRTAKICDRVLERMLLGSRDVIKYPKTDELVNFGESNARSMTADLIAEAYQRMDA